MEKGGDEWGDVEVGGVLEGGTAALALVGRGGISGRLGEGSGFRLTADFHLVSQSVLRSSMRSMVFLAWLVFGFLFGCARHMLPEDVAYSDMSSMLGLRRAGDIACVLFIVEGIV